MEEVNITEAAVVTPVAGTTTVGTDALNYPTPEWARKAVRSLTWITAIWAIISLTLDLKDFGISEATETLIVKYSASFTGLVSLIARFIGVKPVSLTDR